MGVAGGAYDAVGTALAKRLRESPPTQAGLGVDGVRVDESAVAVVTARDLVDERLGHQTYQLLQVDHPIAESRNLRHGSARLS